MSRLDGAKGIAHLNGAQLLGGAQHADFTTVVQHAAPSLHVAPDGEERAGRPLAAACSRAASRSRARAQKTDGYQMNQALLLSPDAEIDTKPELEIFADDVKCSHGATVGELDADQLFYLRSRGIPEAEARVHAGARLPGRGAGCGDRRNRSARVLERAVEALVGEAGGMNVHDTIPPCFDVDAHPRGFPDPARRRSAASRWCSSTAPPRRRSRAR